MKTFQELRKISVLEKMKKKGKYNYLSWAWAVDCLLQEDKDANWTFGEPKMFGETMMVFCTVTAFGKSMTAFLPVMNNSNQPVANPDAGFVNKAMQRCLVKAIALHGIALYIYEGEDFPEEDGPEPMDIGPLVLEIEKAETLDELKSVYVAAVKEVRGDQQSMKELETAKDKRKKEIQDAQKPEGGKDGQTN